MVDKQDTVRCGYCELVQYKGETAECRRCRRVLAQGSMMSTTVVYIPYPVVVTQTPASTYVVATLRKIMQDAAVDAVASIPQTTKAAKALGIPHHRLKQLLRESGDDTDRRKDRRR